MSALKRMLEVKDKNIYINSSSVDLLLTCPRKAQYALVNNYRGESESDALVFGKAIHAGLETFYKTQPQDRDLKAIIAAFRDCGGDALAQIPETDKRSAPNGERILGRYFEVYKKDPWVTFYDKEGPFVERRFEVPVTPGVFLHGQIDCALRNVDTHEIVVCDHKTTSSVSDLVNRVKPNFQFTAYTFGALMQFGLPITRVMVNGIQIAKTKSDFLRVFTDRGAGDFNEMRLSIKQAIRVYNENQYSREWAMNTASCANYGGCQYLQVCSLDYDLRENALSTLYPQVLSE